MYCPVLFGNFRTSLSGKGKQYEKKRGRRSTKYRKIPKISPGAYIFQRPFLRGLFLEGLIFGGAYVWTEICVSKSIGLACSGKEIYHFFFVFLCIWVQAPRGRAYRRGDVMEGFLHCDFGGLIFWRGLYMEGLIFGILRYVHLTYDPYTISLENNWRSCLRFSFLAPDWLFSCNTITFQKYFWCSQFSWFDCKTPLVPETFFRLKEKLGITIPLCSKAARV